MDQAPYEMLSNRVLPFEDVIRIKQTEDVLEKYWNDHRTDETIEYITRHLALTPFDFFQDFGAFWEAEGWGRIGHQLEDLFKRLSSFLQAAHPDAAAHVESIMKYDYLRNQRFKPRKPWWRSEEADDRSAVYKQLADHPLIVGESFASLQLREKDLHKHTILEPVTMRKQEDGWIQEDGWLLAYFSPTGAGSSLYFFSRSLTKTI
ncbi:DUF4080 domain-containing protein, partial [Domibacillus tundrae]|uniref:DUF4080 domain-containing protein n=1 Tax=Domibacillus tundrae TaxID=1587527 RepID=UPI003395FF0A